MVLEDIRYLKFGIGLFPSDSALCFGHKKTPNLSWGFSKITTEEINYFFLRVVFFFVAFLVDFFLAFLAILSSWDNLLSLFPTLPTPSVYAKKMLRQ
jgi:hypothetical protein